MGVRWHGAPCPLFLEPWGHRGLPEPGGVLVEVLHSNFNLYKYANHNMRYGIFWGNAELSVCILRSQIPLYRYKPAPEDQIMKAFEVLDQENKGYLTAEELTKYMSEEGKFNRVQFEILIIENHRRVMCVTKNFVFVEDKMAFSLFISLL